MAGLTTQKLQKKNCTGKIKFNKKILVKHTLFVLFVLQPLTMNNYQARFSTLLYAEELQQEMDMREFDLERVSLVRTNKLLVWANIV